MKKTIIYEDKILHRDKQRGITYKISEWDGILGKASHGFEIKSYSDYYHGGKREVAHIYGDINLHNCAATLMGGKSYVRKQGNYSQLMVVAHKFLAGNLAVKPPVRVKLIGSCPTTRRTIYKSMDLGRSLCDLLPKSKPRSELYEPLKIKGKVLTGTFKGTSEFVKRRLAYLEAKAKGEQALQRYMTNRLAEMSRRRGRKK